LRRHKPKHRIYTVVVGKKKPYVFAIAFAAVIVASMCVYFISKTPQNVYNSFLKTCIDYAFMTDRNSKAYNPIDYMLDADTIMSQASPVFFETKINLNKNTSKEKKESKEKLDAKKDSKNITQKNIASKNLSIKNETHYNIDVNSLVNEKRTYLASGSEPKVLIVHTHACETYSDKNGYGLGNDGTYRTTKTDKNMVGIGEIMDTVFKENGINVIHDKTLCDYPSYNSSYVKSLGVVDWYIKRYPSIEFVFDIHRDAITDDDALPTKLICKINNKTTAQAMIVCGTDALGLSNPYWKDNLILALKIQKNLEEMYPGFMRPINIRKERFNMHTTKGSLLFEVGTHGNTYEEACLAAKYLSEGIVKTLKNS